MTALLICPRCRCRGYGPPAVVGLCHAHVCRECRATQQYEAGAIKAGKSKGEMAWKRVGPYTMACGCDSTGGRCEAEGRLYEALDAAQAGQGCLTRARAAYHAHFV